MPPAPRPPRPPASSGPARGRRGARGDAGAGSRRGAARSPFAHFLDGRHHPLDIILRPAPGLGPHRPARHAAGGRRARRGTRRSARPAARSVCRGARPHNAGAARGSARLRSAAPLGSARPPGGARAPRTRGAGGEGRGGRREGTAGGGKSGRAVREGSGSDPRAAVGAEGTPRSRGDSEPPPAGPCGGGAGREGARVGENPEAAAGPARAGLPELPSLFFLECSLERAQDNVLSPLTPSSGRKLPQN